jgi:hypothetical protein
VGVRVAVAVLVAVAVVVRDGVAVVVRLGVPVAVGVGEGDGENVSVTVPGVAVRFSVAVGVTVGEVPRLPPPLSPPERMIAPATSSPKNNTAIAATRMGMARGRVRSSCGCTVAVSNRRVAAAVVPTWPVAAEAPGVALRELGGGVAGGGVLRAGFLLAATLPAANAAGVRCRCRSLAMALALW